MWDYFTPADGITSDVSLTPRPACLEGSLLRAWAG